MQRSVKWALNTDSVGQLLIPAQLLLSETSKNNMSGRNLRRRKHIDYSKLDKGKPQTGNESSEEETEVQTEVDPSGITELCGQNSEEELDYEDDEQDSNTEGSTQEDGQVESESGDASNLENIEIQWCVENRNLDKLKRILKRRENECKRLQKEKQKELQCEKEDREMKLVLQKLRKVDKTRKSLQRSLNSSRQNSPTSSPKPRKSTKTPRGDSNQKPKATKPTQDNSEYDQILNSFMNLKQGGSDYSLLVANVMQATDNVLALSQDKNAQVVSPEKIVTSGHKGTDRQDSSLNTETLFAILEKFTNKPGEKDSKEKGTNLLTALTESRSNKHGINTNSVKHVKVKANAKQTIEPVCSSNANTSTGKHSDVARQHSSPASGDQTVCVNTPTNCNSKKFEHKKKLVSGKCTKPDESDTKVVVKYAHEKLDPRHVKDRHFDSIDFNFLIAGELEIAAEHWNRGWKTQQDTDRKDPMLSLQLFDSGWFKRRVR